MNAQTEKRLVPGPAGQIEVAIDLPAGGATPAGTALICHPNPTQGGTMDNKVVQTLARAFIHLGWRAVRFNFRGIGKSEGGWDEGRGEVDDALAVLDAVRPPGEALILAGFSFGGYVASRAAQRVADAAKTASDPYSGTLTMKIQGEQSVVKSLNDQITDWDSRLADRRSTLEKTYANLEVQLSQLQSQSSWLTGQLSSLPTASAS